MSRSVVALSVLLLAISSNCGSSESPPPPPPAEAPASAPPPPPPAPYGPVQIEMKGVQLHVDDGIVLDVRSLRGEMVSTVRGQPPVFDDPRSYTLQLATADIVADTGSLSTLLNRHVFGYEDAPLKDLELSIDEGKLKQEGKMKKGVWVPFSTKATVFATPDGRLGLHTESVKALHLPATKLLDLFGLSLEDLVGIEKRRGVEIKDDDVILSPGRVLPPPEMRGHLARAEIVGNALHLVYAAPGAAAPAKLVPPDPKAKHYVYFSGHVIRFGKLTMTGADLQLIDSDDRDPFDFFPAHYDRQLVAGYSKNTPQKGLKTYMPDYADLAARR
jgi:hypothetical protein